MVYYSNETAAMLGDQNNSLIETFSLVPMSLYGCWPLEQKPITDKD